MTDSYTMDEYFESRELDQIINEALSTLGGPFKPEQEEKVIRLRFGIGMDKDYTLEEVGHALGVTRERVRQIEAKALRKLRHKTRSKKLRTFLSFDTVKNMKLAEIERIEWQKKNQQQILNDCGHARWFKKIVEN